MTAPMFDDRDDAGRKLAAALQERGIAPDTVVAVAPTGVPVGTAIASDQDVPLGIAVVNRIDAPFDEERVIGSVTADGGVWVDEAAADELSIGDAYIEDGIQFEREAAIEQQQRYGAEAINVSAKTVVVVDDGIMTATDILAVCDQLEEQGADRIIVAAPVISDTAAAQIDRETVAVTTADTGVSIDAFYREHEPLSPAEIRPYLQ